MSNIYIIIPVFNESNVIKQVIQKIKKEGYKKIIVVDDGSTDQTYELLKKEKIILIRHIINCGKGAAIKTGIQAAKKLNADTIITIDGDGQHDPKDIKKLQKKLQQGYDVVLGARTFTHKTMPVVRIIFNYFANFLTWVLYGIYVSDSQSGFRAYSKKAFYTITTQNNRYEYDSEIILQLSKHKLRFVQVPIKVYYTKYSLNKKQKQNFSNGFFTLYRMVLSK